MAPLIISAVTSMASTLLDKLDQANQAPPLAQQPRVEFDSLLKTRSLSGALGVQPAQLSEASGALMQQLLEAPEVSAALVGQNLPPGSKLEVGADGGILLRSPGGYAQPIDLHPGTRVLAANLSASLRGGQS
ncbi:MAG TPA: hypothetical protein VH207_07040 [Chthoniobacterales bacterium]|jgi:hypothetical protein|nr:hypothetical protein [Chthoniobacterales bacterium]